LLPTAGIEGIVVKAKQDQGKCLINQATRLFGQLFSTYLVARPAYATTEPDVSNTYLFTLIAIAIGVTVLMDRFSRTLLRVFDHPRWLRFVALMGAVSLLLLYRSQSDRMAWSWRILQSDPCFLFPSTLSLANARQH
jgi:hypothetical protein